MKIIEEIGMAVINTVALNKLRKYTRLYINIV